MCAFIAAFSVIGAVGAAALALVARNDQAMLFVLAILLMLLGIFTGIWRIGDLIEKPRPRTPPRSTDDVPSPTIKQMRSK